MKANIGDVSVNMTGNNITGSTLTGINLQTSQSDEPVNSAATLRDLQELRELLEKTAKAVDELEKAVNAKNKPKIKALIGKLTSGAAENIITAVAGDALLSWIKSLK